VRGGVDKAGERTVLSRGLVIAIVREPAVAQTAKPDTRRRRAEHAAIPRELYRDAVLGVAIVLVVLGAVIQRTFGVVQFAGQDGIGTPLPRDWWALGLLSFGYWQFALLAAVAGWMVFERVGEPIQEWLRGKALMLLVPFFTWQLIYYWVQDSFAVKTSTFTGYLSYTILHPGNGLWFLPVLFVFCVLAAIAKRSESDEWGLLVAGVLIAALPASSVLAIDKLQATWWWFLGGFVAAKYAEQLLRWSYYIAGVAVVGYVASLWLLLAAEMRESVNVVQLTGVVTAVALTCLAVRYARAGEYLAYLGRRAIPIYVSFLIFASLPVYNGWGRVALVTVIAVAGAVGVAALLRKERVLSMLFLGERRAAAAEKPRAETTDRPAEA
jgi:hypothetical protein